MNHITVPEVVARANATMVAPDMDITGALASILTGATEALPAAAAAVLVEHDGALEVLATTSHRATDLEILQHQVDEGPCLDAVRTGEAVGASERAELRRRWPVAGAAIDRGGYHSLLATPLVWQGRTFGAFNVFHTQGQPVDGQRAACRALADAVTLVLVTSRLDPPSLTPGLAAALAERAVVEQAKGALAHVHCLEMAEAFDRLVATAHAEDSTLGVTARQVMEQARNRGLRRS